LWHAWGGGSLPQDASGDVAAAANGDHEVWFEFIQDVVS